MAFGAIQVTATVQGAEATKRLFAQMERKVAGKIVKKSVRAGVNIFNRSLRQATEYTNRTGLLRQSFRMRVTSKQSGLITTGRTTSSVKSKRGGKKPARAGYAWLVEHGHRVAVGASGRSEKNVVLRRPDGRPKRGDQTYGSVGGHVRGRFYGRNAFRRSRAGAEAAFGNTFKTATATEWRALSGV